MSGVCHIYMYTICLCSSRLKNKAPGVLQGVQEPAVPGQRHDQAAHPQRHRHWPGSRATQPWPFLTLHGCHHQCLIEATGDAVTGCQHAPVPGDQEQSSRGRVWPHRAWRSRGDHSCSLWWDHIEKFRCVFSSFLVWSFSKYLSTGNHAFHSVWEVTSTLL